MTLKQAITRLRADGLIVAEDRQRIIDAINESETRLKTVWASLASMTAERNEWKNGSLQAVDMRIHECIAQRDELLAACEAAAYALRNDEVLAPLLNAAIIRATGEGSQK